MVTVPETSADRRFVNCTIVTPEGRQENAGIAVTDGKIVAVGREESLPPAADTVGLEGQTVVPGLVDCHIHTRQPGQEHKENWETATLAAAAGGVTTVIGMPNTDPILDTPARVEDAMATAEDLAHVDFQTHVVVTSDNLDEIPGLAETGIAGFKVFLGITFGDIEAPTDGELVEAMGRIAETGKRLGFHEENDEIREHLETKFRREGKTDTIYHNRSRPPIAEAEAVSRVCLFADHTGCPVHMFHLSSGSAAETLQRWQQRQVNATAETAPHYLWFTEETVEQQGTVARVQPPLRTAAERDQLWTVGLEQDVVNCVATDHAPHTDAEKGVGDPTQSVWETPGGFPGLETQAAAMLTFVSEGRLSMEEWTRLHSRQPAKTWGMHPEKGSLLVGTDADFTVVDPTEAWTLDRHQLHSKSTATPWDGEQFVGAVKLTVVRGQPVYDGEVLAEPGYGTRCRTHPIE